METVKVYGCPIKWGKKGYDGGKKIHGRKRHILTDTLGLVMGVYVGRGNQGDRDGLFILLKRARNKLMRVVKIAVDGGYEGEKYELVIQELFGWILEIVKRSDQKKKFEVLPKRWIVERTFGWLLRYRRLNMEYECLEQTSESMIYLGMIRLMLRRIAGRACYCPIGYGPKPDMLVPL